MHSPSFKSDEEGRKPTCFASSPWDVVPEADDQWDLDKLRSLFEPCPRLIFVGTQLDEAPYGKLVEAIKSLGRSVAVMETSQDFQQVLESADIRKLYPWFSPGRPRDIAED